MLGQLQILFRALMIRVIPEIENTLGPCNFILASISHISYLIALEKSRRVCLISSKHCKWLKKQFQLKPLPFSSHLPYSSLCSMCFYYQGFPLHPLRECAVGVYLSCRYHPDVVP